MSSKAFLIVALIALLVAIAAATAANTAIMTKAKSIIAANKGRLWMPKGYPYACPTPKYANITYITF